MNIWFVIYVGTQIGGAIGPLPSAEVCINSAVGQTILLQHQIELGHDLNGGPLNPIARLLRFRCEAHADRPANTFGVGQSF